MGQSPDGMYLVDDASEVASLEVRDPDNLAYVTQTTLSVDDAARVVDALRARFPNIRGPKKDDICYATQNRQDAVKKLAAECDLVIVVGSPNSSNSNRLREVAANIGIDSYMVDDAAEIQADWLLDKHQIGVTAGASAPDVLVQGVIERLKALGASSVSPLDGIEETVNFPLPKALLD
jgi:4-hydroxy-3-methylbut-2-enyl diphosphate reductase